MRLIHPTCSFSPNEGQGIAEEGFVPFEKKDAFRQVLRLMCGRMVGI